MEFPRRQSQDKFREQLRGVLADDGPYTSLYLNVLDHPLSVTARVEEAFHRLGVGDGVRAAILEAIADQDIEDAGMLASVASASGRVVAAAFPDPPTVDIIEQGVLPRLAPMIEADQSLTHHLIASIEGRRLSLIAYPRQGEPVVENLEGGDLEAAAALIVNVAVLTDTSLVVLCGQTNYLDVVEPLVSRSVPITCPVTRVDVDSSGESDPRSAPDDEILARDIVRMVSDRSARQVVEMLRLFRFHAAHDEAVDGVVETVRALREGRAGIVLVHADPNDDRQAWFGVRFDQIANDFEEVAPIDTDEPLMNGRLVDVVLRSAIGQRVPVLIVPTLPDDRLADGIGAITKRDQASEEGFRKLVER